MTVPYAFGAATSAIPLSQLDSNFNTPITLGNTAIQLGNTVTTLNNMTLANVTISSGNVTITNVTVTTANATTVNTTTLIATTANVTTINATDVNVATNVTLNAGTVNGVAYLNGSKVLTTGSALTFDGTNLTVSNAGAQGFEVRPNSGDYSGGINLFSYNRNTSAWAPMGQFASYFAWQVSASEQMRLTSTGLGIGTSSPTEKLHVNNSGDGVIRVTGGASGNAYFLARTSGEFDVFNAANAAIRFSTNGTTRATLDASGNLGLGVTPSASVTKAIQVGASACITGDGLTYGWTAAMSQNAYMFGNNTWKYVASTTAALYLQDGNLHKWYTAASGTAGDTITFTQAMTLDASGNLGVGTTSPTAGYRLHLAGSSGLVRLQRDDAYIQFANTANTDTAYIQQTTSVFNIVSQVNGAMVFGTNATERARITSGGDLLVGTTDSSQTTGAGVKIRPSASSISSVNPDSTDSTNTLHMYSTGAGAYRFYVGWGGTISATSATISAISDQRLKENIRDLDDGLAAVMALKPRKFDWKAGRGKDIKDDRGFIAQEFEQVFPDLIDEWKDPAPEGEEPYKSVRADLIPVLVKAIQELKAEFDAYKATHP